MPEVLRLTHRTPKGLWSEHRRGEYLFPEFSRYAPHWLIDACASAEDRPPAEADVHREIKMQQESLWATLRQDLPDEWGGERPRPRQRAAVRFREAILTAWSRPGLTERQKTANGPDVVVQWSFAAKVRPNARAFLGGGATSEGPEAWHQIHGTYPAWSRLVAGQGGRLRRVALAMHYRMLQTARDASIECPTHEEFLAMGQRYGCFETDEALAELTFGAVLDNGEPLAVLTPPLVDHLLAAPEADGWPPEAAEGEAPAEDDGR